MEKYGVDTETDESKTASAKENPQCPRCATPLNKKANVPACPKCGTKPFEPAK